MAGVSIRKMAEDKAISDEDRYAQYEAEIALQAVGYLDTIAETRGAAGRRASLIATFRQATRLETEFWQAGLAAKDG